MKIARSLAARTFLLLLAASAMSGCYRKVIRASGPGSSRYNIEEPTKPWLSDVFSKEKPDAKPTK